MALTIVVLSVAWFEAGLQSSSNAGLVSRNMTALQGMGMKLPRKNSFRKSARVITPHHIVSASDQLDDWNLCNTQRTRFDKLAINAEERWD